MDSDSTVWDFEHSVECDVSRRLVWEFWTNVANWERLEGEAVEWIRLDGPFKVGGRGVTKSPGQEPRQWTIIDVELETSATIEMPVKNGAMFLNHLTFESLSGNRTRIKQRLSLHGEVPADILSGMRIFEATAPQGLAKMASVIASDNRAAESTD